MKVYPEKQKIYSCVGILAKAFELKSDFKIRIFRYCFVKILANPKGFAAFYASLNKKSFIYKILRPKRNIFYMNFGEDEHIRLTPMCKDEPKGNKKNILLGWLKFENFGYSGTKGDAL